VNPRAEIRAAGGREGHLRGLEALALWPANSLFVEGYLTTRGDSLAETYRMIREAGFEVDGNPLQPGETAGVAEAGAFRLRGEAPLLRPEVSRSA
jgi:biotin synthase